MPNLYPQGEDGPRLKTHIAALYSTLSAISEQVQFAAAELDRLTRLLNSEQVMLTDF